MNWNSTKLEGVCTKISPDTRFSLRVTHPEDRELVRNLIGPATGLVAKLSYSVSSGSFSHSTVGHI